MYITCVLLQGGFAAGPIKEQGQVRSPTVAQQYALQEVLPDCWRSEKPAKTFSPCCGMQVLKLTDTCLLLTGQSEHSMHLQRLLNDVVAELHLPDEVAQTCVFSSCIVL